MNLEELSSYREGNRLEAKSALGGIPGSVWETVSAFANTAGGVILLGVRERADGALEPAGLENPGKTLDDFWNAALSRDKLSARFLGDGDARVEEVDGRGVVVIEVPRVDRHLRPVFLNKDILGSTFRRTHTGDHRCTREEVQSMLRDAEALSQDKRLVERADMSHLDSGTVARYRRRFQGRNENHVWNGLPDGEFLQAVGAAGVDADGALRPTRAGLLMFGQDRWITDEFPHYFLDYRQETSPDTRWEDRFVSFSGDWSGNVYDFYYRVYDKLKQALKVPFVLDGVDRVDDTPAHQALREAIVNCLTNTNWFERRGVVCVWRADALLIANPGDFRIPIERAMRPGESDPRNETMLKMFALVDVGERAGSGMSKIFAGWEDVGYAAPTFSEEYGPDRTLLTLPLRQIGGKNRRKKSAEKIGGKTPKTLEREQAMLAFLGEAGEAAIGEIAEAAGLRESRTRQLVAGLVAQGLVAAEGDGRARTYRLAR